MIEHENNLPKEEEKKDGEGKQWNANPMKKTLTTKELVANAILFMTAGYETTATTLQFIAYTLAMNQSVQNKLIDEIDHVLEKHNEINYDSIADMKYMDMVIDETLRIYPPALRTDRVANADYEYEGLKIKKGQVIGIPIYVLHHDAEIYPDPEEFRPERFSDENKKKRETVAYIPFGAGPRNCIGMRFALIEIKFMLSAILSNYRLVKCEKTEENIVLDVSGLTRPTKPIFVKVEKR